MFIVYLSFPCFHFLLHMQNWVVLVFIQLFFWPWGRRCFLGISVILFSTFHIPMSTVCSPVQVDAVKGISTFLILCDLIFHILHILVVSCNYL